MAYYCYLMKIRAGIAVLTGQRITLLVSKNPTYNDHSLLFKKDKSVNAFYWMDSNIAYSVRVKFQRDKLQSL